MARLVLTGRRFPTPGAALDHVEAAGGQAVSAGGMSLVLGPAELMQLERSGVRFSYLHRERGRAVEAARVWQTTFESEAMASLALDSLARCDNYVYGAAELLPGGGWRVRAYFGP